jgi:hypothetical protein
MAAVCKIDRMGQVENSDRDLFERHVLYEVWMLNETRKLIELGEANVVRHNANIESFCIHVRNLIETFTSKKNGVAKAKSFTHPQYVPWEGCGAPTDLSGKISREISHISRVRPTLEAEKINRSMQKKMFDAIAVEIMNFRAHLKPEFLNVWPADLVLPSEMKLLGTKVFVGRSVKNYGSTTT